MTVLSRRANWTAPLNRLTIARDERLRSGAPTLDLTGSNPTRAGLPWPEEELQGALGRAARARYDPHPLGVRAAREAVARSLGCQGADIVITASTSESYAFLFKLLADPGDEIVTAAPAYPLLEHLAQLEGLRLRHFPLEFQRRWELTKPEVSKGTRAIVVVSPNNPTGSYVRESELDALAAHGLPLVVDEVFREYAIGGSSPASAARKDVLTFALGGLSKSAGLPHYKLGWIRVSGPEREKAGALSGLELIADHFLSVSTPVQVALPELLAIGAKIREAILQRIRANDALLRRITADHPAVAVLPAEGGWSAVLRVPRTRSDEDMALQLLADGVLVQPGYYFDFATDGHLVVSLLTRPEDLETGARRILAAVDR